MSVQPGSNPFLASGLFSVVLFAVVAWSIFWMGLALWHAARRGDKVWFVVFLLVHTVGILEIIYLAFVVKIWSRPTASGPSEGRAADGSG